VDFCGLDAEIYGAALHVVGQLVENIFHSKTPKLKRIVIPVMALAIIQYWICSEEVIALTLLLDGSFQIVACGVDREFSIAEPTGIQGRVDKEVALRVLNHKRLIGLFMDRITDWQGW
jgi:hypothetical protein